MHEIRLRIEREEDLFCRFDESGRTLNPEVADYLADKYENIDKKDPREEIRLVVVCPETIDYERMKAAFGELIAGRETRVRATKRRNRVKQAWLFAVGLVLVAAAILLDGALPPVPVELISIVGSFAVWEAANIWIVENPRTRLAARVIERLKMTKIHLQTAREE